MTNKLSPESVLQAIRERHVEMTPRWRFILRVVGISIAISVVALGLFYLGSLIEFLWRRSHYDALPGFGLRGYSLLAARFPWWHVLVILAALALLYLLIRRYTPSYRLPATVLMAGLGIFLIVGSFVLAKTSFHDRLLERSGRREIPILGPMYRGVDQRLRNDVTIGTIRQLTDDGFKLDCSGEDRQVTVVIGGAVVMPPTWTPSIGDEVVVLSRDHSGEVEADAVRRIPVRPMMWIVPDGSPVPVFVN